MSGITASRDAAGPGPRITGFAGSRFRIGEEVRDGGLILTPDSAHDWVPPPIERLDLAVLVQAVAAGPEFILIGTGVTLIRPPHPLVAALDADGIGIEAMDSRAAARAWSLLRNEGRWIAAALYPL